MASFQEEYNKCNSKKISWSDSDGGELCEIKYIYQTPSEQFNERKAKNFREVCDLIRNFNYPISAGGSGGKWLEFESKVKQLEEPDWFLVGQMWKKLYGSAYRLEEFSLDEDQVEEEILSDKLSEDNLFDNISNLSSLESYLDEMEGIELIADKLTDLGF